MTMLQKSDSQWGYDILDLGCSPSPFPIALAIGSLVISSPELTVQDLWYHWHALFIIATVMYITELHVPIFYG